MKSIAKAAKAEVASAWRQIQSFNYDYGIYPQTMEVEGVEYKSYDLRNTHWDPLLRDLMETVEDGQQFLDLGANRGVYSILVSSSNDVDCHAFEPDPNMINRLRKNISINDIKGEINIHQVALADESTTTDFHISANPIKSSLSPAVAGDNDFVGRNHVADTISVDVAPLDKMVDDIDLSPDIIKVDVEGFAPEAIDGAKRVLETHQPDIFLELHYDRGEEKVGELHDSLVSAGYHISKLPSAPEYYWYCSFNT